MRTFPTVMLALALSGAASQAFAQEAPVSDKVRASVLKRHPQATDMQGQLETHFGQQLLEVSFKDAEGQVLHELFRSNGALFTGELVLENPQQVPPMVTETVKANFPDSRIEKAELVVNPNGVGEEYELLIDSANGKWRIAVNDKGEVTSKERR
ncbi:hypothetical protein [Methylomonas koyamae]|uniref:hypothetical protein n=1 Tax=Methylomonas koyamae TaxID=702114 RepID=UPI000B085AEB|nr:hypothetical protein [Methylomonas koyamae]BBL57957.1 hypothetical protein MKFW12EY_15700 [Methylomonas koyamae]